MKKTDTDIEIPIGKRTFAYRFFEMLPAILSYGAFVLLIFLSLVNPTLAAIFVLLVIVSLLVKSVGIANHTIRGNKKLEAAQKIDWHSRFLELENSSRSYEKMQKFKSCKFDAKQHIQNLQAIISAKQGEYPLPSKILNAVIVATYNESFEVLDPTIKSVVNTTFDNKKIIMVVAYEERGGEKIEKTVQKLQKKYADKFYAFHIVKHPKDIPNEVVGKGGNITHAGRFLEAWLEKKGVDSDNVIVTTLDADNRPHKTYFDYVSYEYIVHENRKNLSYQPVSLFLSNIWDAPAPMRVIATGNSFWNIISSMRPHTLRNFASHSQPLSALQEMNFWSTRTIVEDGHQYWRSYFHFKGNYSVIPLYIPIYQDAVLSDTYTKTLKAQFVQLRRWAYGASDVPYVATRIFTKNRQVPFISGLAKFIRLLDGHVTLACVSVIAAIGGWVPLWFNSEAARSLSAHQLPDVVSRIQQVALIGLFITVFFAFKMLPPRPERYKRRRTVGMMAQWVLMPFTAVFYSSFSALYSQGRLFTGRYLDKFDVTEKATVKSMEQAKREKLAKRRK